jgi:FKBP-type peptidyl-prolyl cis-trans isomerase SlyD
MSNALQAASGNVVIMHYQLTNDDGEIIDSSLGGEPMPYLHGAGNIVPGLEPQVEGRGVGEKFTAVVPPAEGYGEFQGPGPQAISRDNFPADMQIQPGMSFQMEDPNGETVPIWVTQEQGDQVFIDINHPLAGVTLKFEIEITAIRAATESEKTHGHAHGIDGHEGH